jgi:hypothetical protein
MINFYSGPSKIVCHPGVTGTGRLLVTPSMRRWFSWQALRERFVEFYGGTVPFEDAAGVVHDVPAATFDVLYDKIHQDGRLFAS